MTFNGCCARSKLCNVLFSYELARRLSGAAPAFAEPEVADAVRSLPGTAGCSLPNAKQICVAAFNPGLMLDTNFVTSATGTITGWVFWAFTPIIRLSPYGHLLTTGPGSGAVLARLAIGELRSPTSTAVYFDKAQERPSSEFSRCGEPGGRRTAVRRSIHSVEGDVRCGRENSATRDQSPTFGPAGQETGLRESHQSSGPTPSDGPGSRKRTLTPLGSAAEAGDEARMPTIER